MTYTKTEWNRYLCLEFDFRGRKAKLVCPKTVIEGRKWLLKTEYFGAFPAFELEMLRRGYHVAYVENKTRWHDETDDDVKEEFCDFLHKEMALNEKCLPVGMSCGGMHAVYFAAKYPERVAGLYLDAPVMNLLSCPAGVGTATDEMYEEFVRDRGITKSDLINYRNHPIDQVHALIKNRIPVFLVVGDSDNIVPYKENGKILYEYYIANNGDITQVIKRDCGHHPHGLEEQTEIIQFVEKWY